MKKRSKISFHMKNGVLRSMAFDLAVSAAAVGVKRERVPIVPSGCIAALSARSSSRRCDLPMPASPRTTSVLPLPLSISCRSAPTILPFSSARP